MKTKPIEEFVAAFRAEASEPPAARRQAPEYRRLMWEFEKVLSLLYAADDELDIGIFIGVEEKGYL